MAQSSFSGSHFRSHRQPFAAGDIKGNPPKLHYGKVSAVYVPADPSTEVINAPRFAKYGSQQQCPNPFGYITGSFPSNHMEIPKPSLQRNSTFESRQRYGHWQRY